ncbi:MAG: hypothetical protein ACE14V_10740 [bacterium]
MNRTIAYCIIVYLVFIASVSYGIAGERHTLILAYADYSHNLYVLEMLSTGEIITTGQIFPLSNLYISDHTIAVNPDSRFVWCSGTTESGAIGAKQFAISPYGQLTVTGRFIEGGSTDIKFTPNGQLLLPVGPVYRAYPDGSVESTANFYNGALYDISPRGDINIHDTPGGPVVDKIDYSGYSVYNIQTLDMSGRSFYDTAYTPEGDYAIITKSGGVDSPTIYPIRDDGSLDTTTTQKFSIGDTGRGTMSIDGRYLYFATGTLPNTSISIFRQPTHGVFEDTGWRVSLGYIVWQMELSPDGKYLVLHNQSILDVFAIQDDGNLVHQFSFPFATIFGKIPMYFQFAYPPAPTAIDTLNWELYQ